MSEESLWGELPTPDEVKPPIAILREQGGILGDLTNKILVGTVDVRNSGREFQVDLDITAPALDNYFYTVLAVTHGVLPYPAKVVDATTREGYTVVNEEEFRAALKVILSSPHVRQVISSLLAQSKETY